MGPEELENITNELLASLKEKGCTFADAILIVNKLLAAVQNAVSGKAL